MTFENDNIVPNPFVGGSGGRTFHTNESNIDTPVCKIEVWVSNQPQSWKILRGIRLYWRDIDRPSQVYGSNEGDVNILSVDLGERITRFVLCGKARVDRIEISTNKGKEFAAGGLGGNQVILDVGSGYLLGFIGASGIDIDRLRPLMKKFHISNASNVMINKPVGGCGGQPFWACRADDDKLFIQSLDIWKGTYSWATGSTQVLRSIQITWSDQMISRCYGTSDHRGLHHSRFSFNLSEDQTVEKVTDLIIWGADRTDRIQFTTDKGSTFSAGGNGGASETVQCGNGILVGFHGASRIDIDCLSPIFLAKELNSPSQVLDY